MRIRHPLSLSLRPSANVDLWASLRTVQVLQLWFADRPERTEADWYRPGSTVFEQLDRTFGALAQLAETQPLVLIPLPVRSIDRRQQFHLEPVAQLCRRHGLRCLDIHAPMTSYLSKQGQLSDVLHFDEAGHRAVAEALLEPLSQLIAHTATFHRTNSPAGDIRRTSVADRPRLSGGRTLTVAARACDSKTSLSITFGGLRMRITSKGQVTIPVEIRERLGLLPNSEVEFTVEGNAVRIRKVKGERKQARGRSIVEHLRGKAKTRMTTDEIMALTRR